MNLFFNFEHLDDGNCPKYILCTILHTNNKKNVDIDDKKQSEKNFNSNKKELDFNIFWNVLNQCIHLCTKNDFIYFLSFVGN